MDILGVKKSLVWALKGSEVRVLLVVSNVLRVRSEMRHRKRFHIALFTMDRQGSSHVAGLRPGRG